MGHLGFREAATSGKLDRYGQEFSFSPTQQFTGQVKEVEMRFAKEDSGIRVWMEVDCQFGYKEVEAKREFQLDQSTLEHEEELMKRLTKYILETVEQPHVFTQPFSYSTHHHQGSVSHLGNSIPGMIGGLAVGVLSTMLVSEMMDEFEMEGLLEEATDVFEGGFDSFFDGGGED